MIRARGKRGLVLAGLAAVWLSACAGVGSVPTEAKLATDIWDASLVPVRQIDLQTLAFGADVVNVSGFVSAVAVQGDRLYAVDGASRLVLEVSLATESLRVLGSLRDGSSRGLIAGDDGRVYALDPIDRSVLELDPFFGHQRRIPVAGFVAKPVDIALVDGRDLAVVDGLDGGIVMLGPEGGVFRESPLHRPEFPSVTAPLAIAHAAGIFLVLDERADEVVGFRGTSQVTGLYAGDELSGVRAMAVDNCGRFFVADSDDGTVYLGIPDMSIPGLRLVADNLAGKDVADLWVDDVFLYVATRTDGIFVYLVDPGCD